MGCRKPESPFARNEIAILRQASAAFTILPPSLSASGAQALHLCANIDREIIETLRLWAKDPFGEFPSLCKMPIATDVDEDCHRERKVSTSPSNFHHLTAGIEIAELRIDAHI